MIGDIVRTDNFQNGISQEHTVGCHDKVGFELRVAKGETLYTIVIIELAQITLLLLLSLQN